MSRYRSAVITGSITLLTLAILLFSSVEALPLLLVTTAGAPLTVLLALRAMTDPSREGRAIWPSFVIGAVAVPAVVLGLRGVFYAIGFALVEPFADAGLDLLDRIRADTGLIDLLTDYWAYLFIVELAIVAPLAEETTKPLGSLLRRPRTGRDAFMFGAAAGTGFAIVENVLYASGWFWSLDYWLSVSTMRMVGAGLHAFGAAFVSWGVFQMRNKAAGRWRRLGFADLVAFVAHSVWNGTIAVTQVIYAGRSEFGEGALSNDALAWGVALQALLAAIGALITVALLVAGRRVRADKEPLRLDLLSDLATPRGIAAWAVLSTLLLIPSTVMVLVFPSLIAL